MIPLYEDDYFTFRFGDARIIARFHLEAMAVGRRVRIYKMDSVAATYESLLATAHVGEAGWVDLQEPLIVQAGSGFIVVQEPASTSRAPIES